MHQRGEVSVSMSRGFLASKDSLSYTLWPLNRRFVSNPPYRGHYGRQSKGSIDKVGGTDTVREKGRGRKVGLPRCFHWRLQALDTATSSSATHDSTPSHSAHHHQSVSPCARRTWAVRGFTFGNGALNIAAQGGGGAPGVANCPPQPNRPNEITVTKMDTEMFWKIIYIRV